MFTTTRNNKLEQFAFFNLRCLTPDNKDPNWKVYKSGFNFLMRTLLLEHLFAEGYTKAQLALIRIVPDLYALNVAEREIYVYEIEDTAELSYDKIGLYYDLSEQLLDEYSFRLTVYVANRYGLNPTELPFESWLHIDVGSVDLFYNRDAQRHQIIKNKMKHIPRRSENEDADTYLERILSEWEQSECLKRL